MACERFAVCQGEMPGHGHSHSHGRGHGAAGRVSLSNGTEKQGRCRERKPLDARSELQREALSAAGCHVRDAPGVGAGGGLRALPSPQQPGQGYSEALFQLEVPHGVLSSGITVAAKKRLCPANPDPPPQTRPAETTVPRVSLGGGGGGRGETG